MHADRRTRPTAPFLAVPWWLMVAAAGALLYWSELLLPRQAPGPGLLGQLIWRAGQGALLHYLAWSCAVVLLVCAMFAARRAAARRRMLVKYREIAQIRQMSWQDFEMLIGQAYSRLGWRVDQNGLGGADGGIDLILTAGDESVLVQCKRYTTASVGAPVVREMYGLMMHHGATAVAIVCVGRFTKSAQAFAEDKPIDLIDGEALVALLAQARKK